MQTRPAEERQGAFDCVDLVNSGVPARGRWRSPRPRGRRRPPTRRWRRPAGPPTRPTGSPPLTVPVMAAVPVPVIAPSWVPILTRAPLRERPRLCLGFGRNTQSGQSQADAHRENRCSKTRNIFHAATLTRRTQIENCRRQRFFLAVSCQFEVAVDVVRVSGAASCVVTFDRWDTRTRFGPPELRSGSGPRSPGKARRRVGTHTSGAARTGRTAGRGRVRAAPR